MQFKHAQRQAAARHWGPSSWFYQQLGEPAREIVERAYGLRDATPKERAKSQEYLTLALSLFARKIGAEKSQVVHALLTGSIDGLEASLERRDGSGYGRDALAADWVNSFREVSFAP